MKSLILLLAALLSLNSAFAAGEGSYNLIGTWKSPDNSITFIYDGISRLTVKSEGTNAILDCSDFALSASNDEEIVDATQLLVCKPIDSNNEVFQFYVKLLSENPSAIIKVVTNLSAESVGALEQYTFRRTN